jgi:hypothetical protein
MRRAQGTDDGGPAIPSRSVMYLTDQFRKRCYISSLLRVSSALTVAPQSMRPPRGTNDPEHWRNRAAQMRSVAGKMAGSDAAILMNAAEYDKLADRVTPGLMKSSRQRESLNRPPHKSLSIVTN